MSRVGVFIDLLQAKRVPFWNQKTHIQLAEDLRLVVGWNLQQLCKSWTPAGLAVFTSA